MIGKVSPGVWHIRDFGRGLRYQHLTENENAEKRKHPEVIGQFGMGLKDALAVFDRRGITVTVQSPHADVITLHALVSAPQRPSLAASTSKACSWPRNPTFCSPTTSNASPHHFAAHSTVHAATCTRPDAPSLASAVVCATMFSPPQMCAICRVPHPGRAKHFLGGGIAGHAQRCGWQSVTRRDFWGARCHCPFRTVTMSLATTLVVRWAICR